MHSFHGSALLGALVSRLGGPLLILGLVTSACTSSAPTASTTSVDSIRGSTASRVDGAPAPVANGPVATPPAINPSDPVKLRFGGAVTPPNMVHLAPYVAKDMGFFDEVGLDVSIMSFEGGVSALRAANSAADLDVIATSSDPLFTAVQGGNQVKAIGTYAPRLSVVMVGGPEVQTARQLAGRKLCIQDVGGFNHVMSQLVLQQAGVSPNSVQWVNVPTANRVGSIVQGQTDASVLHIDQYYAALAAKPDLQVVARLWETAPDWWYSALVASDDTIRTKREPLVRFMTAVVKAQRFMYTNPIETKDIAVRETAHTPAEVDLAYDDMVRGGIWSVNDGMPRATIERTVSKEVELGVVKPVNPPTYEQIVDRSIVDEAVERNGGQWVGDPRWE